MMMKRAVVFLAGLSVCYGCGNTESASEKDAIAGTYVREYSREILNQLSGNKVGMRTVRDTLYISSAGDKYKVQNTKWSMNEYDNDGWQNMKHGESGPLPSFQATFDEEANTLKSESPGMVPDLVIGSDGKLSVGKKSEIAYTKIN
jgi:hypothetical protein